MKKLKLNETLEVSGGGIHIADHQGIGTFGVNGEFNEQINIWIDKNANDSILIFNNLTFSVRGCFFNGELVDPKKTYSGYYITDYQFVDSSRRTFLLNR